MTPIGMRTDSRGVALESVDDVTSTHTCPRLAYADDVDQGGCDQALPRQAWVNCSR